MTKIEYNGNTIANLSTGDTATLECSGQKMVDAVKVSVNEDMEITTVHTINGSELKFFVGTQAEYDALPTSDKQNLFAIISDDKTKDELYAQIDGLETAMTTLEGKVTTNTTNIATNKSNISKLTTRVSTLETDNTTNKSDISGLATRTTTAESNITKNTNNISTLNDDVLALKTETYTLTHTATISKGSGSLIWIGSGSSDYPLDDKTAYLVTFQATGQPFMTSVFLHKLGTRCCCSIGAFYLYVENYSVEIKTATETPSGDVKFYAARKVSSV